MYILSQIFGFSAMIVSFFIYQQGKRKRVIFLKLITDILWVLNFIFVGGYVGALTTSVSIFREIIFYKRFPANCIRLCYNVEKLTFWREL